MIFLFSGTGNTRWAAQTIAQAFNDHIIDIADKTQWKSDYCLADGEAVGFCFPVHGWQPPHIFREFVAQLRIPDASNRYCYAVSTCGDSIGKAMDVFCKDVNAVGFRLTVTFSLIMPESYVCLPFMYTDTAEREQEKISISAKKLEDIIYIIRCREENRHDIVEGPMPWTLTHIVGGFFNRFMITDKPFSVDDDVCTRCGLCQKVCPTNNITRTADGLPSWNCNGNCTCCLACYHHCPVHAINYRNITRKRGQYFFGIRHSEK